MAQVSCLCVGQLFMALKRKEALYIPCRELEVSHTANHKTAE